MKLIIELLAHLTPYGHYAYFIMFAILLACGFGLPMPEDVVALARRAIETAHDTAAAERYGPDAAIVNLYAPGALAAVAEAFVTHTLRRDERADKAPSIQDDVSSVGFDRV